MSVLDTFVILFQSDISGLTEGIATATAAAAGMAASLDAAGAAAAGVGAAIAGSIGGGAQAASQSISEMADGLQRAGQTADGIGAQFSAMISAARAAIAGLFPMDATPLRDGQGQAAASLDLGAGRLEGFGQAARAAGRDLESVGRDLGLFGEQVAAAANDATSAAAKAFEKAGISLRDGEGNIRSALDLLRQAADQMPGLTKGQGAARLQALGIDDPAMVQRVLQGGAAPDAAMPAMPATAAKTAMPAKVGGVTPADGDAAVFAAVAGGVTAVFLPAMAAAAAAMVAAMAPFAMMAAVIGAVGVAIALLVNDFAAFEAGQDSLIGRAVKKWPALADVIKQVKAAFQVLWDIAKSVGAFLSNVFDDPSAACAQFGADIKKALHAFYEQSPLIHSVVDGIQSAFDGLGNGVASVWEAIAAAIKAAIGVILDSVAAVSQAYDRAKAAVGLGDAAAPPAASGPVPPSRALRPGLLPPETAAALTAGRNSFSAAAAAPLAAQSPASLANTSTRQTTITQETHVTVGAVTVQTQATDAEGISKAVSDALGRQIRQVVDNHDSGVAA